EVDAAQRVHGRVSRAVDLRQPLGLEAQAPGRRSPRPAVPGPPRFHGPNLTGGAGGRMADAARAESRGRDGARAGSNAGSRLTAISGARRSGVRGGSVFRRILEAGVARGAAAFGR